MKGTMELEYITKISILVVVLFIMIALMYNFSDDVRDKVSDFINKEKNPPIESEYIESDVFTASQIANFMIACKESIGQVYDKDKVCFILKSKTRGIGVSSSDIQDKLEGVDINIDLNNYDSSKNLVLVKYVNLGHKISLET